MSNIHDTIKDDDVSGIIIGGDFYHGQVFYDNRPQSQILYGYTQEELTEKLNERLNEIKDECKEAFRLIYPSKLWEFRYFN